MTVILLFPGSRLETGTTMGGDTTGPMPPTPTPPEGPPRVETTRLRATLGGEQPEVMLADERPQPTDAALAENRDTGPGGGPPEPDATEARTSEGEGPTQVVDPAACIEHDPTTTQTAERPGPRSNGAPDSKVAATEPGPRPGRTTGPTAARPPRFLGEYELIEEIARGGMGVVYRACQVKLNRLVALKLVREAALAGPTELRRFRIEAEAVAQLDHPNIVPIHEIGQVDDQPFFSMKLIEGGNLNEHLPRLREDPREAARVMAIVARAVHYAHQRTILHRDIKPSNILLDEKWEPYVTDFGLAKRFDEGDPSALTLSGALMGTPSYMPPEQAEGGSKRLTTAADVYSLGATLYEAITGQPPFRGHSVADTLRQVLEAEPARPRTLRPALDRDLETITLKCLEKDPARRYGSAEDLAEDLERWRDGRAITARRVPAWERALKWVKRRPALAALVAALHLALLGLVIGGVWFTVELTDALDQARRGRYAATMNLARNALDEGLIYQVRDQLETYRSDEPGMGELRGFEWYYLWKVCNPEPIRLRGHTEKVIAVAFHPDGKRMASGGFDATVRLWEFGTGRTLAVYRGHTGEITCLAFSPDGRWLATSSTDRKVRLWDLTSHTGLELGAMKERSRTLSFHPSGARLLGSDMAGNILEWEVPTGRMRLRLKHEHRDEEGSYLSRVNSVTTVYLPDGRSILSGGMDEWVSIRDGESGQVREEFHYHTNVLGMALRPDGKRLALSEQRANVAILDLEQRDRILKNLTANDSVISAVAYSPDGKWLGSTGSEELRIWGADSLRLVDLYYGAVTNSPSALAFSPDGRWVATGQERDVVVRSLDHGQEGRVLASVGAPIRTMAVSGDGTLLATGDETETIAVWDVAGSRSRVDLERTNGAVQTLTFSGRPGDDRLVCVGEEGVALWHAREGGTPVWTAPAKRGWAQAVGFRPDGRVLAVGTSEGQVELRDTETGVAVQAPIVHGGSVTALAYDPGGHYLATAGMDRAIQVWSTRTGGRILGPLDCGEGLSCLAYSPDRRLIAAGGGSGRGGTIWVWNLRGHLVQTIDCPRGVLSLSFSADSKRLASCGRDAIIQIWDVGGGSETLAVAGHLDQVTSVRFDPRAPRLFSAGRDGVVRVWDGADPDLVAPGSPTGPTSYPKSQMPPRR